MTKTIHFEISEKAYEQLTRGLKSLYGEPTPTVDEYVAECLDYMGAMLHVNFGEYRKFGQTTVEPWAGTKPLDKSVTPL